MWTYNGTTYVAVRKFDNSLCLVDESYISPDTDHYLARHFTGKLLSGFKECPVIVD
jgi:hypothetical protein